MCNGEGLGTEATYIHVHIRDCVRGLAQFIALGAARHYVGNDVVAESH